jgi:DNA polymerase-3 subunit alpha
MPVREFVHLHLHTQFSLLDGAIKINELPEYAKRFGYKAVAITDHGNLFGSQRFYKALQKEGLKPIIGIEAYITKGSRFDRRGKGTEDNYTDTQNHHIILLAKNDAGFKNLMKLSSKAFTEGFHYKPRIDLELLNEHREGLICLTACLKGLPTYYAAKGEEKEAEKWLLKLLEIFGREDLYVEIQHHRLEEQQTANRVLIELAKKHNLKLVATCDVHYLRPEDKTAHMILTALQMKKNYKELLQSPTGQKLQQLELHFASPEEVWRRFENTFDGWEKALLNTLEVAEKVSEKLDYFENTDYKMPEFEVPKGETLESYFKKLAREGLQKRLQERGAAKEEKVYWERLEFEMDVISKMGFPGYFLIVQDFINWAKNNGIPVGPGRGSAGGSLVAYALGITDIDPIKHDLLFERFLNPDRVSMPDIDVDFCMDRREEVIDYVSKKYGERNVSQIITYNILKSKSVIRDVCRALGVPLEKADRLAKLIPQGETQGSQLSLEEMTDWPIEQLKEKYGERPDIEDAVQKFRRMINEDPSLKHAVEIGKKLDGLTRHTGFHAAGVVIAPQPLEELVPIYTRKEKDKETGKVKTVRATQYDMAVLEEIGLLKMDFLGLKTLTELDQMKKMVGELYGKEIDFHGLDYEDKKVYDLLKSGKTTGVFQLESSGMQNLLVRLKPDRFDDIIAVLALYRPGPLKSGLVDSFVRRKHGEEPITYEFPELEPILKETYGIWAYQEQIMKMSQILAGFTPGEADTLRKAIGKKKKDLMEQMKSKFIEGAVKRGKDRKKIEELWNSIEKFASYSFNKSHSTAYAYVSYWTAYMKTYYPGVFFAVKLSTEKNEDKFISLIKDAKLFGFELLPPDVNSSDVSFTIEEKDGKQYIRYGLAKIKNVGLEAARAIVQARKKFGKFKSLADFVKKVDKRKVNKKVIEALIEAGAFDFTGESRKELLKKIRNEDKLSLAVGQKGLFGSKKKERKRETESVEELLGYLKRERELLGSFISSHPLDSYPYLSELVKTRIEDLFEGDNLFDVEIAGVAVEIQEKRTRSGNYMAIFNLIDKTGLIECVVFPEVYNAIKDKLEENSVLVITGDVVTDMETEKRKLIVKTVSKPEEFVKNSKIEILLKEDQATDERLKLLAGFLKEISDKENGIPTFIKLLMSNGDLYEIELGKEFRISPDVNKLKILRERLKSAVRIKPVS